MTGQKNIKIVFTNIIFPLKISFNQGAGQPSQISAILIAGPSKWTNCWTVPKIFRHMMLFKSVSRWNIFPRNDFKQSLWKSRLVRFIKMQKFKLNWIWKSWFFFFFRVSDLNPLVLKKKSQRSHDRNRAILSHKKKKTLSVSKSKTTKKKKPKKKNRSI